MEANTDNDASPETLKSKGKRKLRTDTLLSSVILLISVSIVQRSIGFGRGILFCRWLTPEELGRWEMAFSFLILASPLVVLGLPGSFGRYLEHHRQRGELRTFLRRTTFWTAILSILALGTTVLAAPYFSKLIFGESDAVTLTTVVGLSLFAVIIHHFLESMFTAMRMFRIVSAMHFGQSMGFAAISLSLLFFWKMEAISVVMGYGISSMISSVVSLIWSSSLWHSLPSDTETIPHKTFWPKLMRFAVWVWVSNLLFNLFTIADRYMLVHFSNFSSEEALAQVGHYHSSRVVPILIISVVELLSSIVLPYLSKDWEKGQRKEVSNKINFVTKLTAIALLIGSILVLLLSPWLFEVAFRGKYNGGRMVLPMTLCYCSIFGLMVMLDNYLWCAEKGRLCTVPILVALVLNITLNFILLPKYGLRGAVMATTSANILGMVITLWLCKKIGMRLDKGTVLLCLSPLVICGGVELALATLACVIFFAMPNRGLLTNAEWELINTNFKDRFGRFKRSQAKPST